MHVFSQSQAYNFGMNSFRTAPVAAAEKEMLLEIGTAFTQKCVCF